MRFEIRRKEFPFGDAPELDGTAAAYIACVRTGAGPLTDVSRHTKALDAAIAAAAEAHRLNHSGVMGTNAGVRAEWTGDRPAGVMKSTMPVSYRPRPTK